MSSDIQIWKNMADNPIAHAEQIGKVIFESRLFGLANAAVGTMLGLACISKGVDPFELKEKVHVGEKGLMPKSDAVQVKFLNRGGRIKWLRSDSEVAEAEFTHEKYCTEPYKMSYKWDSIKDFPFVKDKSGAIKQVWVQHRRAMLRARLTLEGIRMIDPESTMGFFDVEVQDQNESPSQGQGLSTKVTTLKEVAAEVVSSNVLKTDESANPEQSVVSESVVPDKAGSDPVTEGAPATVEEATKLLNDLLDAYEKQGMTESQGIEKCKQHLKANGITKLPKADQEQLSRLIHNLKFLISEASATK